VIARQALSDACERNFGAPYYHVHRAETTVELVSSTSPKP